MIGTDDLHSDQAGIVGNHRQANGFFSFDRFRTYENPGDLACQRIPFTGVEVYKHDIILKFANQTLKGVIEPEARKWFDIGSDMVDMIGGLPYRDELDYGRGLEAMDILLDAAKSRGIMCHVHVDQFNSPKEKETEQLCDKTIEHGMEVLAVSVHV